MNWAHLPVSGGLYDQSPQLLDEFLIIFRIRGEHDKRKAEEERLRSANKVKA